MPKDVQKHAGTPRQRPVSCRFCRTRKLRCSREAPCSNCVSRGIHCELIESLPERSTSPSGSSSEILERLHRLEKLLVNQKSERQESVEQNPNLGSSNKSSQARLDHSAALSPQALDNDVAWLESIYSGQCSAVS